MIWKHVIVHHTASRDTEALDSEKVRRFHVQGRGWRDVGYHFLVEDVGGHYAAIVGRPLHMPGAHAPGWNHRALGVALVGDFTEATPPDEQLECAARLTASLILVLEMPRKIPTSDDLETGRMRDYSPEPWGVFPHRYVRPTECPGTRFPWDRFADRVLDLI